MAFVGALFSPNFHSSDFPQTFFSTLLSSFFPNLLTPPLCSIAPAFGAALIAVLIWMGTALFNDYYDVQIDKSINPHRPLIKGEITQREVAYWATLAYAIAIVLTLLEGDWLCRLIVFAFVFLGFQYSARDSPRLQSSSLALLLLSSVELSLSIAYRMKELRSRLSWVCWHPLPRQ